MKVLGTVTGVLRDKDTGEITKTFEATNHVQDWWLEQLCSAGSLSTVQQMGEVLFISDNNPGKQKRDWPSTIANCRGGTVISGVDVFTSSYNDSPGIHLGQYVMRFNAPAQDYTINTAGICDSVNVSDEALKAATVVWLATPCVQTTTETLDLYYRLQLLFEDDWSTFSSNNYALNPYDTELLAGYVFGDLGGYLLPVSGAPYHLGNTKFNGRLSNEPNVHFVQSSWNQWAGTGFSYDMSGEPEYFVRRNTVTRDIQAHVGKQLGWVGTYAIERPGMLQKLLTPGLTPLQSVFGHRSTSSVPFYSAVNSQLGLGTLTIDGSAWTNPDFPKYMRLDVTTSGALGVAEYQFRKRASLGFDENTFYSQPGTLLPFTQANHNHLYADGFMVAKDIDESVFTTSGAEAMDRTGMAYAFPLESDPNKVMTVWKDEFSIMDIHDGTADVVTNTTLVGADLTPRFQATDISQVAVDASGDYYISCRNTGLYKLNAAMDTLTIIDSSTTGLTGVNGCKAICRGQGNRLWAYWDHTTTPDIYFSDNGGTSWTAAGFSQTFVDANPNLVFNIQADPNDAGGKLAVLYYHEDEATQIAQNIMVTWWDHAITTNTDFGQIRQIHRTTYFASLADPYGFHAGQMHLLQCSSNQSYWGVAGYSASGYSSFAYPGFLTFGTATIAAHTSAQDLGTYMRTTQFVPDAAGNDAILYISDKAQAGGPTTNASMTVLVSQDLTYEAADSTGAGANVFDGLWTHCYLHSGVWLCARTYTGDFINYNSHNTYFTYCGIPDDTALNSLPGMLEEFYPTWGWTGAVWQQGHAGSKATHAGAEALIDGVTVAWDDTAGPHLDSDHYTFGLYDGIWLDGSTQFDFRWDLYAKPSTFGTDVEAATLPAVTKVSNTFIQDFPDSAATDLQDEVSMTLSAAGQLTATGTGSEGVYNAGARSNYPVIDGTSQSFLPNQTYIPGTDTNNCQGYIEFSIFNPASFHLEAYYGFSPIGVIGTALNSATIAHGLHFDSVTPGNGVGTCTIRVVEGGVERATVTDIPYNNSGVGSRTKGRIALLTNQSVQYEYFVPGYGWQILYTSTPGTVTIENMYLDSHCVPQSSFGLYEMSWNYLDTANADYYLYLGDGIDQGVFQPEFFCIDPVTVKVLIDGTEAVHIGTNDQVTVLATNTYSILPHSGVIRYSALDTGKTVSAEYITVHHE